MLKRIIGFTLGFVLTVPAMTLAQEESEERGQLYQVSTWTVDPADAAEWEANIKKVVEAAGQADIPYRWVFWQQGSEYTLVYPIDNFAYFDDPMQFVRAFSGTPGEELMQEAMGGMQELNVRVVAEEIMERKAEWSYEVETWSTDQLQYGHIDEMWLKPGVYEEFEALNQEWKEFFADLDYPYPYGGYTVHFGDTGRVLYVMFVDDLGKMYGEYDIMKLVEAKGMGERMKELDEKFNAVASRWDHYDSIFRRDLSYWPTEGATQ